MDRRRPSPRRGVLVRRVLAPLVCGLAALLPLACQHEEIETHHVPKPEEKERLLAAMFVVEKQKSVWFFKLDGPIEQVTAHKKEFDDLVESVRFGDKPGKPEWKLPAGWTEEPGTGMRQATLLVGGRDSGLKATVVKLGAAGGLYMNVNRWRNQIGLPATVLSELPAMAPESKINDVTVHRVDLKGPGNPLAQGTPMDVGAPKEKPTGRSRVKYVTPDDWEKQERNVQFSEATFVVASGDEKALVTISPLPRSERRENVERWCRQIGLTPPKDAQELNKLVRDVKVDGLDAGYADLTGPATDKRPASRILGVMVDRGEQTWFIKMTGPADLVGAQKKIFEKFLDSVKFE